MSRRLAPGRWLKAALRPGADLYLRLHHAALHVPEQSVLVLGHMRSGSTLLLHLLMGSPELLAAGERNTAYTRAADFDRLARDCFLVNRRPLGRVRYVADQLNHDHLLPDPQLILHPKARVILLARRPTPSIASIVHTFGPLYGDWPPERAAAYYVGRINTLADYARRLNAAHRRFTFVSYEALTAAPQPLLDRLRQDLDLVRPLSPQYRAARFTGRRGDPSARIRTGEVRPDAGRGVELPATWAARAEEAYAHLMAQVGGP